MSATSRRQGENDLGPYLAVGAMVLLLVGLVVVWVGAVAGAALGSRPAPPGNPFALPFVLLRGSYRWPGAWATATVVIELLAAAAAAVAVARVVSRHRRGQTRVDRAARYMAKQRDLSEITTRGAEEKAARFGLPEGTAPGLPVGTLVSGSLVPAPGSAVPWLYQGWEDTSVDIWGTRRGKTSSRIIPAIRTAPAACYVTSNRRDVVDACRDMAAARGRVWVFDVQDVVGEEPTWWWNPLSYVTDISTARTLATLFDADTVKNRASSGDAYFDPKGRDLLAFLLLAAAMNKSPITQAYIWTTQPGNDDPVEILAEHGFELASHAVAGVINAPDKQRAGVYGTAEKMAACLVNPRTLRWVTPDPANPDKPQFDPEAFITSTDTVFSISMEGPDSAGALVTALTVAVAEAAVKLSGRSRGGRLPVPLVMPLDEAANVCRWPELPNLYSHLGGRGIIPMVMLQSWAQGVEVWGENGMAKLWSAANIRVYGGGDAETRYLGDLTQLIGDYDRRTLSTSTSTGRGGSHRSRSNDYRSELILDVADLTALPRGRAVLLPNGAPAALVQPVPWMATDYADILRASIVAHDPAAQVTLDKMLDEAADFPGGTQVVGILVDSTEDQEEPAR